MNVGIAIVAIVLLLAFVVFIGGTLIQYTLEYWVSQARGTPVDVPKGPCILIALVVGWNIGIPAAIITWVASLAWDRPVAAE